jgi:hypothetical protein
MSGAGIGIRVTHQVQKLTIRGQALAFIVFYAGAVGTTLPIRPPLSTGSTATRLFRTTTTVFVFCAQFSRDLGEGIKTARLFICSHGWIKMPNFYTIFVTWSSLLGFCCHASLQYEFVLGISIKVAPFNNLFSFINLFFQLGISCGQVYSEIILLKGLSSSLINNSFR